MTRPGEQTGRLFAVERRRRPDGLSTCTDVVHVPTSSSCPICSCRVTLVVWTQPALFVFGGEGQAVERRVRRCPVCRWSSPIDEASLNPRRFRS